MSALGQGPDGTMREFQASTRDPQDHSSAPFTWHLQDEPPRSLHQPSLHPHFLRSESGKTFEKGFWKEKKNQCCLKHERTNSPTVASTARKDLSHLTSKCPKPRRTERPQQTSDSLGNLRVDETDVAPGGYSQTSPVHP